MTINAWCFEPDYSLNVTKTRAMLAAYQRARPLSAAERSALPVLHGALLKNEQDVHLFERLAFMTRRG